MPNKGLEFIEQALALQESQHRTRRLMPIEKKMGAEVLFENESLIDFTSNDYLGLARHPLLIERSIEYTMRYGASSSASRLLTGNIAGIDTIEKKLAHLKGSQEALIFNTGYQANSTLLPVLADRYSLVLVDRLCHNSLLHGVKLSQAKMIRFRHNDLTHLEELLILNAENSFSRIWIVTESVFGMEGDRAPLDEMIKIAKRHGALLYVDEAHATGVLGRLGMGLTAGSKDIDIVMGTFGKALGCFGSYVCMSKRLKEYLINFCPGFIYTTALPPSVIGSIDASLDLIPTLKKERTALLKTAENFRKSCKKCGLDTGMSSSHIIPIILQDEKRALFVSNFLRKEGVLGLAIRPPTVPSGQARIRFALSCMHSDENIKKLVSILEKLPLALEKEGL